MRYFIDKKKKKPAYLQLYELLRKDIESGNYKLNAKLPSKRIISEETCVSVITTEHALDLLLQEGYVESRERSGYFVIYRDSDFLSSKIPTEKKTVIDFTEEENDANGFPYSTLTKTMRKVMLDYRDRLFVRSPNKGVIELREAITDYLMRYSGIKVSPERIIIGSGAEYLYGLLAQLLGKEYAFGIENPSYEKIRKVYHAFGIKTEKLAMTSDGIESRALNESKATVLHVTPYNSYPSGITATASKRREYLAFAENRNGYIIEDNYDSELSVSTKNEDTLFSLSDNDRVIYLNTFSETISCSIRVGYMVLPQNLLTPYEEKLGFYSCTVPVFEQFVLAELISCGEFERHINRVRRLKRKLSANRDTDKFPLDKK